MYNLNNIVTNEKFIEEKNNIEYLFSLRRIFVNIFSLLIALLSAFYIYDYSNSTMSALLISLFLFFFTFEFSKKDDLKFIKYLIFFFAKDNELDKIIDHKHYLDYFYNHLDRLDKNSKENISTIENTLINIATKETITEQHDFYTFLVREFEFLPTSQVYKKLQVLNKKYGICL
jgi:hypothetical protein